MGIASGVREQLGHGRKVRRPSTPTGLFAVVGTVAAVVAAAAGCGGSTSSAAPRSPATTTPPASRTTSPASRTTPAAAASSAAAGWQASIARTMPADLPGPAGAASPGSCANVPGPGWLAAENRLPGTALPLAGATFADDAAVAAYAARQSAGCGDRVPVSVSAPAGDYQLRAWRVGDYGGAGARVVWTSAPFAATTHPAGADPVGRGPQWPVSVVLQVPPTWRPGLYLLQVVGTSRRHRSGGWVPLVVRPGPGSASAAVYVAPTMTWAAYDPYGGASLYRSFAGPDSTAEKRRARTVAMARPSVMNGQRQVAQYTAPLVQALEEAGIDVDYLADTDVDARPGLLAGRAEVILGSHAEYATTRLYDALEAARNAGTNLAFLGGNQVYWHVRLTRSPDGTPDTLVLFRELAEDPARLTFPGEATVRWRDAPLNRPEATLIGAQYAGLGMIAPWYTLSPPAWTGLHPGETIPMAAAGEVDAASPASPPRTQVLAQGTTKMSHAWIDAMVTYYVAPSGAAVLDTGSMDTGCLARGTCPGLVPPPRTRQAVRQLVHAVVTGFVTPRFGTAHPVDATAGTWMTGAAFATRYGSRVVGRDIKDDDD